MTDLSRPGCVKQAKKPLSYVQVQTNIHESLRMTRFVAEMLPHMGNCPPRYARRLLEGVVVDLFIAVGAACPDGYLEAANPRQLAVMLRWPDDPGNLWDALFASGWLMHSAERGCPYLEGWERHAGKAYQTRVNNAERQRKSRENRRRGVTRNCDMSHAACDTSPKTGPLNAGSHEPNRLPDAVYAKIKGSLSKGKCHSDRGVTSYSYTPDGNERSDVSDVTCLSPVNNSDPTHCATAPAQAQCTVLDSTSQAVPQRVDREVGLPEFQQAVTAAGAPIMMKPKALTHIRSLMPILGQEMRDAILLATQQCQQDGKGLSAGLVAWKIQDMRDGKVAIEAHKMSGRSAISQPASFQDRIMAQQMQVMMGNSGGRS